MPRKASTTPRVNTLTELKAIRQEIADLNLVVKRKEEPRKQVEGATKNRRRPNPRDLKYFGGGDLPSRRESAAEVKPTYDLAEAIKLQDVESYYAISVDRHVELIMKNGFELQGRTPDTVALVRKRLAEIGIMSGQPFSDAVRELARNGVSTSNPFLVLSRDETRSSGSPTKMWGKIREPISSISIPDPSTISCKQTKTGRPYLWVQTIDGTKREWSHHDVIHIPFRKKSGYVFGTPFVVPVLEDIRALRKLEMISEHVAHKNAFPLMHWRVGTKEVPADMVVDPVTGLQAAEVDIADQYAQQLAQEGYIVTSERHEVKIIGAEGETLDIQPYIEHYELRVLAGLRLSMLDLGRGDTANRGTATALSQILVDACTEFQDVLSSYLTELFFDQLIMEGGYDLTEENRVYLVFPPIDTEEARAQQNHGLQLYIQGGISRAEFRRDYLNSDDFTPEEEANTYLRVHLIPLADANAKAKAAVAAATASAKGVSNKTRPANQHGKAATKKRVPANDLSEEVDQIWSQASSTAMRALLAEPERGGDIRPAIGNGIRLIGDHVQEGLQEAWQAGVRDFVKEANEKNVVPQEPGELHHLRRLSSNFRSRDLKQLGDVCMIQAGIEARTGLPKEDFGGTRALLMPAFEATRVILFSKLSRVLRGARVLGYLDAARASHQDSLVVRNGNGVSNVLPLKELSEAMLPSIVMTNDMLDSSISLAGVTSQEGVSS